MGHLDDHNRPEHLNTEDGPVETRAVLDHLKVALWRRADQRPTASFPQRASGYLARAARDGTHTERLWMIDRVYAAALDDATDQSAREGLSAILQFYGLEGAPRNWKDITLLNRTDNGRGTAGRPAKARKVRDRAVAGMWALSRHLPVDHASSTLDTYPKGRSNTHDPMAVLAAQAVIDTAANGALNDTLQRIAASGMRQESRQQAMADGAIAAITNWPTSPHAFAGILPPYNLADIRRAGDTQFEELLIRAHSLEIVSNDDLRVLERAVAASGRLQGATLVAAAALRQCHLRRQQALPLEAAPFIDSCETTVLGTIRERLHSIEHPGALALLRGVGAHRGMVDSDHARVAFSYGHLDDAWQVVETLIAGAATPLSARANAIDLLQKFIGCYPEQLDAALPLVSHLFRDIELGARRIMSPKELLPERALTSTAVFIAAHGQGGYHLDVLQARAEKDVSALEDSLGFDIVDANGAYGRAKARLWTASGAPSKAAALIEATLETASPPASPFTALLDVNEIVVDMAHAGHDMKRLFHVEEPPAYAPPARHRQWLKMADYADGTKDLDWAYGPSKAS